MEKQNLEWFLFAKNNTYLQRFNKFYQYTRPRHGLTLWIDDYYKAIIVVSQHMGMCDLWLLAHLLLLSWEATIFGLWDYPEILSSIIGSISILMIDILTVTLTS